MSTKRKPQHHAPDWDPMAPGLVTPDPARDAQIRRALAATGLPEEEIAQIVGSLDSAEVWVSNMYVVHVERREDGSVNQLSIRRRDRKPIRDWRHFQRIKNDVVGEDAEAIELYPAQSRVVDTANQYWLWVLPPGAVFEVGFGVGVRSNQEVAGSRQRALPQAEGWEETTQVSPGQGEGILGA